MVPKIVQRREPCWEHIPANHQKVNHTSMFCVNFMTEFATFTVKKTKTKKKITLINYQLKIKH